MSVENNGWISVKESFPESNCVLTCIIYRAVIDGEEHKSYGIGITTASSGRFINPVTGEDTTDQVAYWQPIPDVPE